MSDDNANEIPSTFLTVIKNALDGGLIRIIASKPVQQAIGRLVSAGADIPAAYMESISRNKRRQTEATDKVFAAVADAAAVAAANDKALIDRSIERWIGQLGKKQASREKVAVKTLEFLSEINDEDMANMRAPSEDFMLMFEDLVEKVSSEELSDLMARILAGEICKSGTISRKTLQTVAILDRRIIQTLIDLLPFMLDRFMWAIPTDRRDDWYNKFWLLNSVSITDTFNSYALTPDENGNASLRIGDKALFFSGLNQKFPGIYSGAKLTPTGIELISVLPPPTERKVDELAAALRETESLKRYNLVVVDFPS